jgi:hypothetical protein
MAERGDSDCDNVIEWNRKKGALLIDRTVMLPHHYFNETRFKHVDRL